MEQLPSLKLKNCVLGALEQRNEALPKMHLGQNLFIKFHFPNSSYSENRGLGHEVIST